ncbi:hypothetical protein A3F03_02470 [Candidatus Roizmanbacteria bacterium RIFCSPHIGHO2_12_FULL_41_11]|uniref:Uncharacterized protein n=3 Tax=Candidatus Roizmaniibacteriota TaxID=1752723 RepID=A0A1F7JR84_9BACT|nr:MAG: hypothetical protein A3F03_02470 [Candidatus Roizmanbacteria bacterium RIFCSPHIGHO2_12_FULL_41_11]OGK51198.1 MAG: hypothetical protein A2966_00990 [Candidatus Roizmanbacteria bacterium RIFCSPLOWO2_01_FULL_41_22]OGK58123.1 MAG: hypothetical protein A3H86_03860 [Candidatus Roizmanbacteria bacterium RIFCSPLOWO2_02_FULL_41_9]
MQTSQVQLKVSLSEQLSDLLKGRAQQLGVPVTQLVKYIIIKEVEKGVYPIFTASDQLEKISEKALKEIDQSKVVDDIDGFFQSL